MDLVGKWMNSITDKSDIGKKVGSDELRNICDELLQFMMNQKVDKQNFSSFLTGSYRNEINSLMNKYKLYILSFSELKLFISSLKKVIWDFCWEEQSTDSNIIEQDLFLFMNVLDKILVDMLEVLDEKREKSIQKQQEIISEIELPVVKVWNDILLVPLVGLLDSDRTQKLMENLLSTIEKTYARVAILDISGIPVVDTVVARHLMQITSAANLMGAQCIITGMRANLAQTIVRLGIDLSHMNTKTTLADGLRAALKMVNQRIIQIGEDHGGN